MRYEPLGELPKTRRRFTFQLPCTGNGLASNRLNALPKLRLVDSLSVMFAALKSINMLNAEYGVRFEEVLTDNGPEMASPTNKAHHPMERVLQELGTKHRYTRPYRPQTNGKVERFWRTLNEDLIEETVFESVEELKDELVQYLLYYNTERPHQGLGGKTPVQTLKLLSAN